MVGRHDYLSATVRKGEVQRVVIAPFKSVACNVMIWSVGMVISNYDYSKKIF